MNRTHKSKIFREVKKERLIAEAADGHADLETENMIMGVVIGGVGLVKAHQIGDEGSLVVNEAEKEQAKKMWEDSWTKLKMNLLIKN